MRTILLCAFVGLTFFITFPLWLIWRGRDE